MRTITLWRAKKGTNWRTTGSPASKRSTQQVRETSTATNSDVKSRLLYFDGFPIFSLKSQLRKNHCRFHSDWKQKCRPEIVTASPNLGNRHAPKSRFFLLHPYPKRGIRDIRMVAVLAGQWARPPNSYRSTDANLRPWPLAGREPESRLRSGPDHSLRQSLPQMMGQNRNKTNVVSESRTLFPLAFSKLHNKLRPAFVRQVEMALGKVNFLWMRSLMICWSFENCLYSCTWQWSLSNLFRKPLTMLTWYRVGIKNCFY